MSECNAMLVWDLVWDEVLSVVDMCFVVYATEAHRMEVS